MKKYISIICALFLVGCLMAGCGSDDYSGYYVPDPTFPQYTPEQSLEDDTLSPDATTLPQAQEPTQDDASQDTSWEEPAPDVTVDYETNPDMIYSQDIYIPEALTLSSQVVWTMSWEDSDGVDWSAHYVFADDGTCYMIMADGYHPVSSGIGTYQIDDWKLHVSLVLDDSYPVSYSYRFHKTDYAITQISDTGLAFYHSKGQDFLMMPDYDMDVDGIINSF